MLLSPENPHRDIDEPEKLNRFATVEIDEEDFQLISDALHSQIKRCNNNAINCMTGYLSAGSAQKADDWRSKSEKIKELMGRLEIEMS